MHHTKALWYFLLGFMLVGSVNLSGCVTTRNLNAIEADENMVKNCQFVGTFNNASANGFDGALALVINEAAEKGATHYVIMDTSSTHHQGEYISMSQARIRGYKCPTNNSTSINQQNTPEKYSKVIKNKVTQQSREIGRDGNFIAYENGTILDTKTNLMWAAKDNGTNIKWSDAKNYCENYRGGGYTDWRTPTEDELASLNDANQSRPNQRYPKKDIHVATKLIDITSERIWSNVGGKLFNFDNGRRESNFEFMAMTFRALPVRDE